MVMHRCAGVKVRTAGPCAGWSRSPRLIATSPTASLLALDFRLVEHKGEDEGDGLPPPPERGKPAKRTKKKY